MPVDDPTDSTGLLEALDPRRSAVVEACAGSGKTWLLVSRMVRLLLAGADPSQLLAITFTRKAAGEMRVRLDAWLALLASAGDAEALDFLRQRGLTPEQAQSALPQARGLLEKVLDARPGPLITTFHGWFFHLLSRAPLALRVAGEVAEQGTLLEQDAWSEFLRRLGRERGGAAERAFADLLEEMPLITLRGLLQTLLARRAEWEAYGEGVADPAHQTRTDLETLLGVREEDAPAADLLAQPPFQSDLAAYRSLLEREAASLSGEARRLAHLAELDEAATPAQALDGLARALLTGGRPRILKLTGTMQRRLPDGLAERYVELHYRLAEPVAAVLDRLADQRALRLHRLAMTCGLAWLETYADVKAARGVLDFTDAEVETARLLHRDGAAEALLMKLDARWKHLLLDEFQDATPAQWRILLAWLDAYGADEDRPTVFLVGDPKQSIYRFRRAEPRLFEAAALLLEQRFQARRHPQNETRRCAPRIVAWVNALFAGRPDYPGFQAHTAHQTRLPGWCELYAAPAGDADPPAPIAFRRPLQQPAPVPPHPRALEAEWVARRIGEIVGQLEIQADPPRPARHADILVLTTKRADLEVFERALRDAGVPFRTNRRGALLDSLEARDIAALLASLLPPHDDLHLAHALRSPAFGFSHADLQSLAARPAPQAWLGRLIDWAAETDAPERVRRAARLLQGWQAQAGRLPAHDLLDRIYHEGEVRTRYAQALAPGLASAVLANLEELPGLALRLSGGRYPSLPRFLDELRRLRDQAADEGPDEPPPADADAVRMLTIHGAKGLEAPVVFLIKADATEGRKEHTGVLVDWPPEAERPAHFSLHGASEWRGSGRDALFAAEAEQAERERLNLLYVAMTRARQALFVSGVGEDGWLAPLRSALESVNLAPLPGMLWRPDERSLDPAPDAGVEPEGRPPSTPPVGRRRPDEAVRATPQALHGTVLHAWLERALQGWSEEALRARVSADATVAAQARAILAIPELAPAFDPACHLRARNELECLDAQGQVLRMDRVVEFTDQIWVLDYKSGGLDEPDPARRAAPYQDQMAGYREVLSALYPAKPVRCVLVFADGRTAWL